jgi:hypothetical protein
MITGQNLNLFIEVQASDTYFSLEHPYKHSKVSLAQRTEAVTHRSGVRFQVQALDN